MTFMIFAFRYWDHQTEEDEMSGSFSMYEGDEVYIKNTYLSQNLMGRYRLLNLDVDGRKILKWNVVNAHNVLAWTWFPSFIVMSFGERL
jgi:hypothetical protein